MINSYEASYKSILREALAVGTFRDDRTGVGSYSLFSKTIRVNISKKFPLITGRRMFPKIFNTELDWFLNGETNIKRFQDNRVTIWDNWADENGDLGPVYGYQMINFNGQEGFNQLLSVVDSLRSNPDSRRHIISLWNPLQTSQMALPPCYLYFQFFVDGGKYLNMFVVQRSADLFLGIPYDVALFSKFLLHVAELTELSANILDLHMVDAHVYKNQVGPVKEYLKTTNLPLPTYTFKDNCLELIDYVYGKVITADVAV